MRSKVLAVVAGMICTAAAAAVLNHFSCIGECEPAPGASGALVLPLAVVYTLLTACVVLPLSLTLTRLGPAIAAGVVSGPAAGFATWLFYRPEIDTPPSLLIPFGIFFTSWFIGGYVFVRMWPNKRFQPTGLASGSAGG